MITREPTRAALHRPARRRGPTLLRAGVIALALCALVALSHTLDPWAYAASTRFRSGLPKPVALYDWYQLLRQLGSALPWALITLLLLLAAAGRRSFGPNRPPALQLAALLPASVITAGVSAELLKPVFGRLRPEDAMTAADNQLVYRFMPVAERLGNWSDLGIPSSHGSVSVAAACAIATLYPRTLLVTLPLAAGTCFTRIVNNNHYLSDTVAGAALGLASALLCARLLRTTRA